MKREQVQCFEKLHVQMKSLHTEIGTLSKKSPNDAVNKFKLKLINNLLQTGNELLKGEYKPLAGFDQFDEDDIPTNSDVTVVLAQYLNCLEKLRADNIRKHEHGVRWFWIVDGRSSEIETVPPRKLKEKYLWLKSGGPTGPVNLRCRNMNS